MVLLMYYFKGSQVEVSSSVLKVVLILANSVEPDEMQHYVAFHLGLHYLCSIVGNMSDCRSRGHEFDPGPVPYFTRLIMK